MKMHQFECKNCGYQYTVSHDELKRDKKEKRRFRAGAILMLLNSFGGDAADTLWADYNMADAANNIVDYKKCPSCGSRNIYELR